MDTSTGINCDSYIGNKLLLLGRYDNKLMGNRVVNVLVLHNDYNFSQESDNLKENSYFSMIGDLKYKKF